jgi:two-component sensor histidine kinase
MPPVTFQRPAMHSSTFEQELERHRIRESRLRKSIIRERILLTQAKAMLRQTEITGKESEHRLLNGLQLITSLLSIQSRTTKNAEASTQLTLAANRVATLANIHLHLHELSRVETPDFKQFLSRLCDDLIALACGDGSRRNLTVKASALKIPRATAVPLGFIASELLTNSIKYAEGKIAVSLEKISDSSNALSISDDGPGLPAGFDPVRSGGLGMKIVLALVSQIGGELRISKGDHNQGSRFRVVF